MLVTSLLIPVAALAVTVTGATAFNSDTLRRAGFTPKQVAAFNVAKELREAGDYAGARNVLVEAGINEGAIGRLRSAMGEYKLRHNSEVYSAILAEDYSAFRRAIEGSPLADIINTETEFIRLVEAQRLIVDGHKEAGRDILEELGLSRLKGRDDDRGPWGGKGAALMNALSLEQQAELKAAFANRDHEKVREILEAAGITKFPVGKGFGLGAAIKNKSDTEVESR